MCNANVGAHFAVMNSQEAWVISHAVGATDARPPHLVTINRTGNRRCLAFSLICDTYVSAHFAVKGTQQAWVISVAIGATDGRPQLLGQTEGTASRPEWLRNQWFAFALICFTYVGPLLAVMDAQCAS